MKRKVLEKDVFDRNLTKSHASDLDNNQLCHGSFTPQWQNAGNNFFQLKQQVKQIHLPSPTINEEFDMAASSVGSAMFSRDDSQLNTRTISRRPSRRTSNVSFARHVSLKKGKHKKMVNNYKVLGTLGSGSFAKVMLFQNKETNIKYAAKKMNKAELKKRRVGRHKTAYDLVLEELNVLQSIEHPNVIWLHEIINDDSHEDLYVVTEYYSGGSLGDIIKKLNINCCENEEPKRKRGLGSWQVRLYFIDMLRALHYIHNVIKVVHKDIKPDNIMIGHNQEAILIDFGVAVQKPPDDLSSTNEFKKAANNALGADAGTYLYYAPELFQNSNNTLKQFGEASDIWAMGLSFYQILTGHMPYADVEHVFDLRDAIEKHDIDFSLIKCENARIVIQEMLQKDPLKRATLSDLVRSAWVTDNGKEQV